MGGLDVSRLSSASAKDDSGPGPHRGGNNRRTARTSSRLDRRPASCRAGSKALVRRSATVSTGELCGIEGSIGVASAL